MSGATKHFYATGVHDADVSVHVVGMSMPWEWDKIESISYFWKPRLSI